MSAVLIGAAAVLTAAVTLAATSAFIVPGTGTHNINPPDAVQGYKQNARLRFMAPAFPDTPPCTDANCPITGISYPASFWPIPIPGWCPGLSCDTWNVSVATGVQNLAAALPSVIAPDDKIILFGYSQGGQVVTNEMYRLMQQYPGQLDQFKVVTIGNIANPQGLWSRFNFIPGLTVPILDVTFGPQLPTQGIESYNFTFEYDPVGDAPLNWWNPLAVLNALAAFDVVHGNYLVPNSNDPTAALPYGYTDQTLAAAINSALSNCTEGPGSNCRTYQDAKFILIPWQGTLPILQPVMDLADSIGITPLVKPFVDLIQPALKVLIDLGYDRIANPGIPRTMNLIPIFNPIKLAIDLVNAVGQGIEAFIKDITGSASTPAPAPAPVAPPAPLSAFSAVDDNAAKLARVEETEPAEQSKLDANASTKRVQVDDSAVQKLDQKLDAKLDADGTVEAQKVDLKPQTEVTVESKKHPTDDDGLNQAFTISTPNTNSSGSASTTKTNDGNMAEVIELRPGQREPETTPPTSNTVTSTVTSSVTSNVASNPGAGEQQQGQSPSTSTGEAARPAA